MNSPASTAPPRRAGSLRWRLLVGTLAWISLSVAVAGWGLASLFRQHVTQQLHAELMLHLNQLTAAVNIGPDGKVNVFPPLSDPRFDQPLSGLYWQIDRAGNGVAASEGLARSRSLWDQTLPVVTADPQEGYLINGPENRQLYAVARLLTPAEPDTPRLRLVVAADRGVLAEPIERFNHMLAISLGALAAGLVLAAVMQVLIGLRPLARLRRQLSQQPAGSSVRIEGRYPSEVQPLVDDFNRMLTVNDEIIQRARTQAGNLAHAVKTPLAILANAAAAEQSPLAELTREQVEIARRQIDHHLARARAAASSGAADLRTPLHEPMQGLVRAMRQLYAERKLDIALAPHPPELCFRGEPHDLQEMVGNLLDNACKWANRRVLVTAERDSDGAGRLAIHVDDDGAGIAATERERIFQRGVRMDEQRPGSGLGLDIVRDLACTYGGDVQAGASPLGGLRITLLLPAA